MANNFNRVLLENSLDISELDITISKLNYNFISKPLLIGGKALEYYRVRDAGKDIDFVIKEEDYEQLIFKYPNDLKDIFDDLGVCKYEFEMWKSICLFDYDFLAEDAIETEDFLIISFEKLMFLKVLTIGQAKSLNDLALMRDRMAEINTMIQDYF
jgi:hypothetical protein